MAAYAEGLNVLAKADIGAEAHAADAETAPLTHPEYYRYDFDLAGDHRGVAAGLGRGQLAARPDRRGPRRSTPSSTASRAGSATRARAAGRSTRRSTRACPCRCCRPPCSSGSASRGRSDVADKVLSAMRAGFGGHVERSESSTMSRGTRNSHQPPADALVLFGATGDLAKRKLFPALYHLVRRGELTVPVDRRGPQRLDRRGLPDPCPRVDHRARRITGRGGDRQARRADGSRPGRLRRPGDLADARRDARRPRVEGRRLLHGDPAGDVPDRRRGAGVGRPARARTHRGREAVRPRSAIGHRAQRDAAHASSPRSGSSASTTTWARRRSRTCSCSASRT